jgi:hypothetical protein
VGGPELVPEGVLPGEPVKVVIVWKSEGEQPLSRPRNQIFRGYRVATENDSRIVLQGPDGKTTIPTKNVLYWKEEA